MHVIVVGAGEVGTFVAESLSKENHDVAVVDIDRENIRKLQSQLDAHIVYGSGANPKVLEAAGIEHAEMVVAVTNSDETNLLVSGVADDAGVATKVIRLEDKDLRSKSARKLRSKMGVSHVIDPDFETGEEVLELIEFPGTSEVAVMAGGEVIVVGAVLPEDAELAGVTLQELAARYEPEWEFLVGAISREGETIIPRGNHALEAYDHVWILCRRRARKELFKLMGLKRPIPREIVLLGGGSIAETVASGLADRGATRVTVVERDPERALELAEELDKAMILQGEIADPEFLDGPTVENADMVIASTGEDDANVLACIAAKQAGCDEAIAVIHRLELLPVLHSVGIDVALSPRTAMASAVMRYVRGGGFSSIQTFLEGDLEVLELEVDKGSRADGEMVAELRLPKEVLIGAIVRDGRASIARGRSEFRARDKVIAFARPDAVAKLKDIFG